MLGSRCAFRLCCLMVLVAVDGLIAFQAPRVFDSDMETIVKVKTAIVTSVVPSSCVKIAPTLLPCRNIRSIRRKKRFLSGLIDTFLSIDDPFEDFASTNQSERNQDDSYAEQPNTQSWGEYFGLVLPTATITSTYFFTTTVFDPSVTITFSIRGCKPSRLPFDLPLCATTAASTPEKLPQLDAKTAAKTTDPNRIIDSSEISPSSTLEDNLIQKTTDSY